MLIPPWFLHLPLVIPCAWQGRPVLLAWAPQIIFDFIELWVYIQKDKFVHTPNVVARPYNKSIVERSEGF